MESGTGSQVGHPRPEDRLETLPEAWLVWSFTVLGFGNKRLVPDQGTRHDKWSDAHCSLVIAPEMSGFSCCH